MFLRWKWVSVSSEWTINGVIMRWNLQVLICLCLFSAEEDGGGAEWCFGHQRRNLPAVSRARHAGWFSTDVFITAQCASVSEWPERQSGEVTYYYSIDHIDIKIREMLLVELCLINISIDQWKLCLDKSVWNWTNQINPNVIFHLRDWNILQTHDDLLYVQ